MIDRLQTFAILVTLILFSLPRPVADPGGPDTAVLVPPALVDEVAEIRGLDFLNPVPVSEIDEKQAREYMTGRLAKFHGPGQIAAIEEAYSLLGLIPDDVDVLETLLEVLKEQAGGFYDPESKSFFIMSDVPPAFAPVVIVHELTHALEDQHFDLDERLVRDRQDDDRLLAHAAVQEGTATLVMNEFMGRAVERGELDEQIAESMAAGPMARADALRTLPEVFRRQLLAPYILGSSFVAGGDLPETIASGFPVEQANRLYEDPPLSSEQILHPDKYWDGDRRDEPLIVDLGEVGRALGKRWRIHFQGTLGELTIGSLVGATTPDDDDTAQDGERWTNEAASGWGGDSWQLWRVGDANVVLLGTLWDSPEEARQFAEALPEGSGLERLVSGNAVAIAAGDLPGRVDRVLARMIQKMTGVDPAAGAQ